MAKLTKATVAALGKGKKEVTKPKTTRKPTTKVAAKTTTKPVSKAPVKTPVKAPRKTTAKAATKLKDVPLVERKATPLKSVVETKATPKVAEKISTKAVLMPRSKKVTLSEKTKEVKPAPKRAPKRILTDTSKLRKYNNLLRENLRNLIYDKNLTIAKVARKMGLTPSYLFNVLRMKDKQGNESNHVIVLDIAYGICDVIGANISSVLPEAEVVNPIYKSKNDLVEKLEKLEEENKQLDFLYTQTKNQFENKVANFRKVEAKFKKLDKIKDSLTALVKSIEELNEESKS